MLILINIDISVSVSLRPNVEHHKKVACTLCTILLVARKLIVGSSI